LKGSVGKVEAPKNTDIQYILLKIKFNKKAPVHFWIGAFTF
jgi:hypothetical protein